MKSGRLVAGLTSRQHRLCIAHASSPNYICFYVPTRLQEVLDFPPPTASGRLLDAHAAWHWATVPLTALFYSWLQADADWCQAGLAQGGQGGADGGEAGARGGDAGAVGRMLEAAKHKAV